MPRGRIRVYRSDIDVLRVVRKTDSRLSEFFAAGKRKLSSKAPRLIVSVVGTANRRTYIVLSCVVPP